MFNLPVDPILVPLFALIIGILLGRLWGYFKYKEKISYNIKHQRSTSSYVLGISYLIAGERDLAISELARAAKTDTDRIELYIILGNLYREKGQLEKAIQIHRSILHRKDLSPIDLEMAQLALGMDFMRAGMMRRAKDSFTEILKEKPENAEALKLIQRCYEEERNWKKAYDTRQKVMRITRSKDYSISSFILAEWGIDKFRDGDLPGAIASFNEALSLYKECYPAYEFLGKIYHLNGENRKAAETWEKLIELIPQKAFLVLSPLYDIYKKLGTEDKIYQYCDYIKRHNESDWRTNLFLATIHKKDKASSAERENLFSALKINLNSLFLHQQIWKMFLRGGLEIKDIKKYIDMTEENIFTDPFICTRCHYKISEFKRRCPHCRSWDTLVEERL
ncbi:MAG: tetratricopeptide repeat protein [Acidobacteria bacterium]|nr:tetratricopeptide repeat protein [Acidobacteriota bacterium]